MNDRLFVTRGYVIFRNNKMKSKNYHTIRTVLKSNQQTAEEAKSIPLKPVKHEMSTDWTYDMEQHPYHRRLFLSICFRMPIRNV